MGSHGNPTYGYSTGSSSYDYRQPAPSSTSESYYPDTTNGNITNTTTTSSATYITNDPSTLDQRIHYASNVGEYIIRLRNIHREIRIPMLKEFFHELPIIEGGIIICHNHLGEGFIAFETADARDRAMKRNGEKITRR